MDIIVNFIIARNNKGETIIYNFVYIHTFNLLITNCYKTLE